MPERAAGPRTGRAREQHRVGPGQAERQRSEGHRRRHRGTGRRQHPTRDRGGISPATPRTVADALPARSGRAATDAAFPPDRRTGRARPSSRRRPRRGSCGPDAPMRQAPRPPRQGRLRPAHRPATTERASVPAGAVDSRASSPGQEQTTQAPTPTAKSGPDRAVPARARCAAHGRNNATRRRAGRPPGPGRTDLSPDSPRGRCRHPPIHPHRTPRAGDPVAPWPRAVRAPAPHTGPIGAARNSTRRRSSPLQPPALQRRPGCAGRQAGARRGSCDVRARVSGSVAWTGRAPAAVVGRPARAIAPRRAGITPARWFRAASTSRRRTPG
jgi:hypothetical protein